MNWGEKTARGLQTSWEDLNGLGLHVNSRATAFSGGHYDSGNAQNINSPLTCTTKKDCFFFFFTCQTLKEVVVTYLWNLKDFELLKPDSRC